MSLGRRQLLCIGTCVACARALGCAGPDAPASVPAVVAAGNVSSLPVGTVRAIAGESVAICRDGAGIYAMTLICTHQGCDMSGAAGLVGDTRIQCGCHGSIFDAQGSVVQGPARSPLQHFVVSKDPQGNLTIHGDQPATAQTRLPG